MFQNQVYINPAIGLPGDFASSNPMFFKVSSTGLMVADSSGVTVGKFACLNNGSNSTTSGTVTSVPGVAVAAEQIGFVHRENNAQITTYLAESGYVIAQGEPVALFAGGDFLVNADVVEGTPSTGAPVYWDTLTGHTIIGTVSSPPSTTILTKFVLVSDTATANSTVIISSNA